MKKSIKPVKYGQRLYGPFKVTICDKKNICQELPEITTKEDDARLFAKHMSVPARAILTDSKGHWIEYTKGVITSWSVEDEADNI